MLKSKFPRSPLPPGHAADRFPFARLPSAVILGPATIHMSTVSYADGDNDECHSGNCNSKVGKEHLRKVTCRGGSGGGGGGGGTPKTSVSSISVYKSRLSSSPSS